MKIPLHVANIGPKEKEAITEVLNEGVLRGGGPYWRRASELLEGISQADRAMLTTSCTHALEMAAMLLEVGEGDEVIIPSYTFPSTAIPFVRRGATIQFCEIKSSTLNMDPTHLRDIISDDTLAVVPVHYAGVGCDMDEINTLAQKHDVAVVEDAAQGVNATYKDRPLGSFGDIGCYSFHETKNYSAGEGGAILLNEPKYVERAERIIYKGTNYIEFQRDEVDRYTWVDIGSSYLPTELQAALVYTQLQRREELLQDRREIFESYQSMLSPIADTHNIQLPEIPSNRESNYHIYWMLTETKSDRVALEHFLRKRGIGAASHYEPLHASTMGSKFGYKPEDLTRTTEIASRLLRLPIHSQMAIDNCSTVVRKIADFFDLEYENPC